MKSFMLVLGFTLISLNITAPTMAAEETIDKLRIENAYAYATTSVQKNGAAFMVVHNDDSAADTKILKAETDVSEHIELHTHIMDGDVMMMREAEHYEIPAQGSVTLEPMGHHIMLIGLKAPLQAGESFPLTLHFDSDEKRVVDVQIKNPGDGDIE